MSLLGLEYGSGSSSDEDDTPITTKLPTATPTTSAATTATIAPRPSTTVSSLLPPPSKRQKIAPIAHRPPASNTSSNTTRGHVRKTKKGPTIAEKRRLLMAAPTTIPDSDSEEEEAPAPAPAPDIAETGFVSLLPQPKQAQHRRGTGSAVEAVHVSDGASRNAPTPQADADTKDAPFVPYAIAKKQKEKRDAAAAKQSANSFASTFFGGDNNTTNKNNDDNDDDDDNDNVDETDLHYTESAGPSVAPPSYTYPTRHPSTQQQQQPTLLPQHGYGGASISVNAAPSSYELTTNATSAPAKAFGYGKAPVVQSQAISGPSVETDNAHEHDDTANSNFEEVDVHHADFQQLLGAKERNLAKWGRKQKEEITFVDVDQNNAVGSFDEWKMTYGHMQGSIKGAGAQSHTKSSLDKQKHQLGWLALQAKERQQDLEVKWASGEAKRKAAKMRYGF